MASKDKIVTYAGVVLLASIIGLPGAFFTIALPAQMRDGGASLFEIGLVYIVWLPSALKWIWAPWLERRALPVRRRTRTIAALSLMLALCFLLVAPLAERMMIGPLVALAAICAALALSLQLLYAGWAMRCLNEAQCGRANGFAAGGMVLGGILGGGVLPWAAGYLGWWTVMLATCAAMAATGFAGGLLRDQGVVRVSATAISFRQGCEVLRNAPLLVCLLLISIASGGDVTLPARLVDAGISPERTGLLLGSLAMGLIVPASLLSGWLVAKYGIGVCVFLCALLKSSILLALAVSPLQAGFQVAILSVLDFVLAGALTVLTWQFYMLQARGSVPVAAYAVLTSLDALFRFVSAVGAGGLAEWVGYPMLFTCAALITLGAGIAVVCVTGLRANSTSVTNAENEGSPIPRHQSLLHFWLGKVLNKIYWKNNRL